VVRKSSIRRWVLVVAASALLLGTAVPADAQIPFTHVAFGSGIDGLGNRLSILAEENLVLGGDGIAFVRLANQSGRGSLVVLDCVIFDERPGNGFHFVYSSGRTLNGARFFIGVFDDHGPGRPGPYDAMYTQTTPVNGPCNVAAERSYPNGWDPVSSGDFVVE
jgi:hypothetical protein